MNKELVIEVSCLVDFDELDADDQTSVCNCAVDGSYGLTLTDVPADADEEAIAEATSLQFQRNVAIACLDDFEIIYRKRNALDRDLQELETVPFETDEP